ncbi:MAG: hypothetical protein AABZ31_05285 [Bdellovibrionota bacterium]
MKTTNFIKSIIRLSLVLAAATALAACSKEKSSSTASGVTSGYYLSNGYCYSSTTGQIVTTTYCSSATTTTGYYLSGGYCYSSTGQVVATSYCTTTTTTTGTTGGVTYAQCLGTYYYWSGYGYQPVYCTSTLCRGYMMYSQAGVATYCQ